MVRYSRLWTDSPDLHNDLALGPTFFEIRQRLLRLIERKYVVDHRPDGPRLEVSGRGKEDKESRRAIDLGTLDARQRSFLADLEKMKKQAVSYFEIYPTALGPGIPRRSRGAPASTSGLLAPTSIRSRATSRRARGSSKA